jgi:hypothetical protein
MSQNCDSVDYHKVTLFLIVRIGGSDSNTLLSMTELSSDEAF